MLSVHSHVLVVRICPKRYLGETHLYFPFLLLARVLGKMGATIKKIQETSNTYVKMNQDHDRRLSEVVQFLGVSRILYLFKSFNSTPPAIPKGTSARGSLFSWTLKAGLQWAFNCQSCLCSSSSTHFWKMQRLCASRPRVSEPIGRRLCRCQR